MKFTKQALYVASIVSLVTASSPLLAGQIKFHCECQSSMVNTITGMSSDDANFVCDEIQDDDYGKEINFSKNKGKVELQKRMMVLDPSETDDLTRIEIRFAPRNDAKMTSVTDVVQDHEEWSGARKSSDWKTIDDFNLVDVEDKDKNVVMKTATAGFGGLKNGDEWGYAVQAIYSIHSDNSFYAEAICMASQ